MCCTTKTSNLTYKRQSENRPTYRFYQLCEIPRKQGNKNTRLSFSMKRTFWWSIQNKHVHLKRLIFPLDSLLQRFPPWLNVSIPAGGTPGSSGNLEFFRSLPKKLSNFRSYRKWRLRRCLHLSKRLIRNLSTRFALDRLSWPSQPLWKSLLKIAWTLGLQTLILGWKIMALMFWKSTTMDPVWNPSISKL